MIVVILLSAVGTVPRKKLVFSQLRPAHGATRLQPLPPVHATAPATAEYASSTTLPECRTLPVVPTARHIRAPHVHHAACAHAERHGTHAAHYAAFATIGRTDLAASLAPTARRGSCRPACSRENTCDVHGSSCCAVKGICKVPGRHFKPAHYAVAAWVFLLGTENVYSRGY